MKINVEYTSDMIKELIRKDIENKIKYSCIELSDIKIKVRSKQNYREKEFEDGELNVKMEVEV
jgi:hypothetical protein